MLLIRRLVVATVTTGLMLGVAVTSSDQVGNGHSDLAQARRVAATHRTERAAVAAGYIPTDECTELPGVGGMGYHYVHPEYLTDGILDPAKPEVLVFVDGRQGRQLGAVEYFQADADQDLATDDDRPSLFGTAFDGPMPGHEPGMPVHYDLHVWLGVRNPDGMFAAWNPDVSCAG